MEFARIIAVCVIGAFLSMYMRHSAQPLSLLLTLFISISVVGTCILSIMPFIEFFGEVTSGTAFASYAGVLVKVCGIGILTRLASEICRDAGENGLASKAMLVGKTAVLLCALPVIKTLFEQVKDFLI